MLDTLIALLIRVAPLAAGLVAGLFLLALATQAYRDDGTLNVSSMIRALLIVALATTIAFPREFFGVGVNSVALLMAFILFGLSAPSQGLNVRLLGPYLIFVVPFIMATVLHIVGGGGFAEASALRALAIGLLGSFLAANYFNSARDLRPLFLILLPVLVFGALLSIAQAITGRNYLVGDLYNPSGQDFVVAFGFGSNNVLHAMSMMAGLAISIFFYLTAKQWKWLFLTSAGLMIIGLILSSAQSAWGGGAVMIAVVALLTGGGAATRRLLLLVAVIGISVFLVFRLESSDTFSPLASIVRERANLSSSAAAPSFGESRQNIFGGSLEGRLRYWEEARRLFGTSPVWGLGFSEFRTQSIYKAETHNLFLTWATETGALGLSGFLLMFWIVFVRAASVAKSLDPDSRLVLHLFVGLLAGYLFVGLFWHLEVNRLFWLSFGLLGGMTGSRLVGHRTVDTPFGPQASGTFFGERA